MTNEEILKKAIEKAVKGGYDIRNFTHFIMGDICTTRTMLLKHLTRCTFYYTLIFSHDFAKAFWGEELEYYCPCCGLKHEVNILDCKRCGERILGWFAWQWHLEKMVLEKEPLKYLEKFLDKEVRK